MRLLDKMTCVVKNFNAADAKAELERSDATGRESDPSPNESLANS